MKKIKHKFFLSCLFSHPTRSNWNLQFLFAIFSLICSHLKKFFWHPRNMTFIRDTMTDVVKNSQDKYELMLGENFSHFIQLQKKINEKIMSNKLIKTFASSQQPNNPKNTNLHVFVPNFNFFFLSQTLHPYRVCSAT